MQVYLLTHTLEPEKIVTAGAKLCYSDEYLEGIMNGIKPEEIEKYLNRLLSMNHLSPFEHAYYTFGFEDISIATTRHLNRHRIGSPNERSTRYVNLRKVPFIVPDVIKNNPGALHVFEACTEYCRTSYETIVSILKEAGLSEREAIDGARYVLPLATSSQMIFTFNARSLFNIFEQRCCKRASDETRKVANRMLTLAYQTSPIIFSHAGAPCERGKCTQGKMGCKNPIDHAERIRLMNSNVI